MYESPERHSHIDYQQELEEILDRELSAENLTTYAEEALSDLIAVLEQLQADYKTQPTIDYDSSQQRELASLSYFGLDPAVIDSALDRIMAVSESTERLNSLVAAKTRHIDGVLVPTDSPERLIETGSGGLVLPKTQVPKLNTLMLLLEQKFGIDIEDDEAVSIAAGKVPSSMMRSASYHMVEIPSIDRLVLTCDEIGNYTFVMDNEALDAGGFRPEDVAQLTKTEINTLLEENPRLGKKVRYSTHYVPRLLEALGDEPLSNGGGPQNSKILRAPVEQAPEGYLSVKGIYKQYGHSDSVIRKAISELAEDLGEPSVYRFNTATAAAYSPDQVDQIIYHIGDKNEAAPEGYLSAHGISKLTGRASSTVARAIESLGDKLGDTKTYLFGLNAATTGYSPEQIKLICDSMPDVPELAPKGYLSVGGMCKQFGHSARFIQKTIDELGEELGVVSEYRFVHRTAIGYSPEQVAIIRDKIDTNGEPAPEGYVSAPSLSREMRCGTPAINKAVAALSSELGEVRIYQFGRNLTEAFSPEQAGMIRSYINSRGELAPDGYLSLNGMHERYGHSYYIVKKAIDRLGGDIGETQVYRFGPKLATGYSPAQIDMVLGEIETIKYQRLGKSARDATDLMR